MNSTARRPALFAARGHTLIEILISASVLAMLALFIMAVLGSSRTTGQQSKDLLDASSRAEAAMEALLRLPVDQLVAQDGATFQITDMNFDNPNVGRFHVTPVPDQSGLYELRTIVEFTGQPGRPGFRVELVTKRST